MALNLNCETLGKNVSTINLSKVTEGVSISLSKRSAGLKNIVLKLVWNGSADLDASLIPLTSNGTTLTKDNAFGVWYLNEQLQGIKHSGDLRSGGTEEISVNLDELDGGVQSLVFAATSHSENSPIPIGTSANPVAYLVDADKGEALYEFPLDGHSTSTCVELVKIYKDSGGWKVSKLNNNLGCHAMGLQGILTKYVK